MIGETINIKAVEVTSSTGKQERWLHVVSHVDPFICKKIMRCTYMPTVRPVPQHIVYVIARILPLLPPF